MAKSLYKQALFHKYKSEDLLNKAVQEIVREKGFSEDQVLNFGASWASGSETVVSYKGCGELADLDMRFLHAMTKEEIMKRLLYGEDKDLFENEYY